MLPPAPGQLLPQGAAARSFLAGSAWPQAATSPVAVGGWSWLRCSLEAPCPCRALAALTEAGASKQRRQWLLAWLLAGYFLSQYSQANSCVFSKNLVLELGLGVCGVSPVAESWREVLDKWDVPVMPVHHREGTVQQDG